MNQLNWESTTMASLSRIPSTEIANNKKSFLWLWQCLPCLSFLIVSHLTRSAVIGSYLYESAPASPSLTSMMALNWRSHKPQITTSPRVSLSLSLPWRISCSDLVRAECIKSSTRTYAEVKARWDSKRSLSWILLWHTMTRPPMMQLSACVTMNTVPHP